MNSLNLFLKRSFIQSKARFDECHLSSRVDILYSESCTDLFQNNRKKSLVGNGDIQMEGMDTQKKKIENSTLSSKDLDDNFERSTYSPTNLFE